MDLEHATEVIEHHKACKRNCEQCKEVAKVLKRTRDNMQHLYLNMDEVMPQIEADYRAGLGLDK